MAVEEKEIPPWQTLDLAKERDIVRQDWQLPIYPKSCAAIAILERGRHGNTWYHENERDPFQLGMGHDAKGARRAHAECGPRELTPANRVPTASLPQYRDALCVGFGGCVALCEKARKSAQRSRPYARRVRSAERSKRGSEVLALLLHKNTRHKHGRREVRTAETPTHAAGGGAAAERSAQWCTVHAARRDRLWTALAASRERPTAV